MDTVMARRDFAEALAGWLRAISRADFFAAHHSVPAAVSFGCWDGVDFTTWDRIAIKS